MISDDLSQRTVPGNTQYNGQACLIWTGAITDKGYGTVTVNRSTVLAHRYAYEQATGRPIPHGLQVDHLCRVRNCVNPNHMELVTHYENHQRATMIAVGVCRSGKHEINSEDDIYRRPDTRHGTCRACMRERNERYAAQRRHETASA